MRPILCLALCACIHVPTPDFRYGETAIYWNGHPALDADAARILEALKTAAPYCHSPIHGEITFYDDGLMCGIGKYQRRVSGCMPQGNMIPMAAVVYKLPLDRSALWDEAGHIAWIECHGRSGSTFDGDGNEVYDLDFSNYLALAKQSVGAWP